MRWFFPNLLPRDLLFPRSFFKSRASGIERFAVPSLEKVYPTVAVDDATFPTPPHKLTLGIEPLQK